MQMMCSVQVLARVKVILHHYDVMCEICVHSVSVFLEMTVCKHYGRNVYIPE